MGKILKVGARQILDSRGNPTVECELCTDKGCFLAAVPSGASTGKHEALELRDGGKEFHGRGVKKAVSNIRRLIAPHLKGMPPGEQKKIDRIMLDLDGTKNKAKLGANAILAVSLAAARAGAADKGISLFRHLAELYGNKKFSMPVPMMNIINGGKHAGFEQDIQEHCIMPIGVKSFSEALRAGAEVYQELGATLKKRFGNAAVVVGDEGGFVPPLPNSEKRLEAVQRAIENCGYSKEIVLALDCAASEFFDGEHYTLWGKDYSSGELIDYYSELLGRFSIYSLEDPLAEDDWRGWQEIMKKFGKKKQIIGDDLLVSNPVRIKKAAKMKACNALLLKVNQIGSLSEALEAAALAGKSGWNVVVSHRSGETSDDFIADLAVGIGASQAKFGAPARSERTAKYNRLLRIEEFLGGSEYAGKKLK